jgi:hypothetical protein
MPDEKVQYYNPHTAKFEDSPPPGADPALANPEMHAAIAKSGKLPSDRTEEELAGLEPGRGGVPVVTAREASVRAPAIQRSNSSA